MLQKYTVVHYANHIEVTIDVDCIKREILLVATNNKQLLCRVSGKDAKRYFNLGASDYARKIDHFNERARELATEFLRMNPEPHEDPATYLTE